MTAKTNRNDVTIFSQGMGYFRHEFSNEATHVKLPFKNSDVDAVLATLELSGPVKYTSPPSYKPDKKCGANVSSEDALLSILKQLSGSKVSWGGKNYIWAGIHGETVNENGSYREDNFGILLGDDGAIVRVAIAKIPEIKFLDEIALSEIRSALQANLQSLNPDSTYIEFDFAPEGKSSGPAIVEYATPVAAWKMRYAIKVNSSGKDGDRFRGSAIIDNNTDVDWNNSFFHVVVGDPVVFQTDYNLVKIPQRTMVHLVDSKANVPVQAASICKSADPVREAYAAVSMGAAPSPKSCAAPAKSMEFKSEEIADFEIFSSSQQMTIKSKKSAVVPLFDVALSDAEYLLFYNVMNHPERPYKSLKFVNKTEKSLCKGKVVIYDEDVFAGEAIMETLKPTEEAILSYGLDNNIKILCDRVESKRSVSYIKLHKGESTVKNKIIDVTSYRVKNSSDKPHKLKLEHNRQLEKSKFTFSVSGDKVNPDYVSSKNGIVLNLVVSAGESYNLHIEETVDKSSTYSLGGDFGNLIRIIGDNESICNSKEFKACAKINANWLALNKENELIVQNKSNYVSQMEAVRQNLTAIGQPKTDHQNITVDNWTKELDSLSSKIKECDNLFAVNLKKSESLMNDLTIALTALDLEWKE